jgi:hypothetical protein
MYIPSAEMGDYEEARQRRKSSGPLYPLSEEGAYGAPPREKPKAKPRPPLPEYEKRDRKPKVYAAYAVSSECSMHSHKLDKNEQATRGRTPPSRKDSGSVRRESVPRQQAPAHQQSHACAAANGGLSRQNSISRRRSAPPRQPSVARRESMSRASEERPAYQKPQSWKDSLRGMSRDSVSPTPVVRQQRRPSSTLNRKPKRQDSESKSPTRKGRTSSSSPDRRRQSHSPGLVSNGRGDKTSADWGYTDFSTFTAARKSSEVSQGSRKSSAMTDRSSMGRQSFSRDNNTISTSNSRDYSRDYSTATATSTRDYTSSERDYSGGGGGVIKSSRRSGDFSGMYERSSGGSASNSFSSGTYSKSSANKIGLSTLKAPVITEWDGMGILGLSSKMFKDSSVNQQDGFMSSSSSFMRRESVTTKVM